MSKLTKVSELNENHPFSEYVRILGRGKTGRRSLDQNEAYDAMRMILQGEAEEAQIGAFLMLLRVKEESPEELAGFVQAAREVINAPKISVDVDWSSYAGKKNQYPWSLLAAKLLAQQGLRVFIHGADGTQAERLYTEESAKSCGIAIATHWQAAEEHLALDNIVYMPMQAISPTFYELLFYRRLFGLRSVMHTVSRLFNPLEAAISLQGVFHPSYGPAHQQASRLLQQPLAAAFKGEGGEAEIRPDANTKIHYTKGHELGTTVWPRLIADKAERQSILNPHHVMAVWNKTSDDAYATAAVTSSVALVLWLQQGCNNYEQALAQAQTLWAKR